MYGVRRRRRRKSTPIKRRKYARKRSSSLFSDVLNLGFHGTIKKVKGNIALSRHKKAVKKAKEKLKAHQTWTNIKTFFKR